MKQTNDHSISNLKAIMLLGIFFAHSFAAMEYIHTPQAIPAELCNALAGSLTLSLGAFFLLSGYLTNPIYGETRSAFCLLLKALLVPSLKAKVVFLGFGTPLGLLNGMIGFAYNPADGPLWYIRALFLCLLIYPAILRICRLPHKSGIIVIALVAIVLAVVYPLWPAPVAVHFRSYILPSFMLGCFCRIHGVALHDFSRHWILAILCAMIAYCEILHLVDIPVLEVLLERRLLYILLIPIWLALAELLPFKPGSFFYQWVTEPSFFVYATHALCGSLLLRILAPHVMDTPYKLMVLVSIYFLGGGSLVYMLYIGVKRTCPRILGVFTGGH